MDGMELSPPFLEDEMFAACKRDMWNEKLTGMIFLARPTADSLALAECAICGKGSRRMTCACVRDRFEAKVTRQEATAWWLQKRGPSIRDGRHATGPTMFANVGAHDPML